MDQPLFKVEFIADEDDSSTLEAIAPSSGKDDVDYLFPAAATTTDPTESNPEVQLTQSQTECIKRIRNYLFALTKSVPWTTFTEEIDNLLKNTIQPSIIVQNTELVEIIAQRLEYKQKLEAKVTEKTKQDNSSDLSIFEQHFTEDAESSDDLELQKEKFHSKQLSYFAIQSLISILLILIKSAEKNDPFIIQQILTLAGQLCEQLPMKSLLSEHALLYKSLAPLIRYTQELSSSADKAVSKQAMKILLSFSVAKGSFEDLLLLLKQLIFNTNEVFNVRGLIKQLNNNLIEIMKESSEEREFPSLDYLKTIHSYPNEQLLQINDNQFTGPFLSSIILSHLDIENTIHSPVEQCHLSSISCEFHRKTFQDLFHIIEGLAELIRPELNQILTVCLRLFTMHLQILVDHSNDRSTYISETDLKVWFDLLFKLSSNEQISISKEASKALIHVINLQTTSFIDKLSLFQQYISENKHRSLIEQLVIELNKTEILANWIESLCDETAKSTALNILYWFIDRYFNDKENSNTEALLISFQKILFYRLIDSCEKKLATNELSRLFTDYLTYIFKKYLEQNSSENELFSMILNNLALMSNSNEMFNYECNQPIFISILPLLAEYCLHHLDNNFLAYLLGKLTYVLIIGSPQDSLESKHFNKLKLPLFSGGCVTNENDDLLTTTLANYSDFKVDNSSIKDEEEFLMSIYNNTNDGARLITKLKASLRNKPHMLQKSIEQQANEACAAIFAVYVKLYQRINLAKSELVRNDQNKPHSKLISIFEYANRISAVFSTIKGQGGDCVELHKQIKMRALFLLSSVKASDLISPVKEELTSTKMIDYTIKPAFHRQYSRWTKARHVLKILRNLFQACLRFKRFMLEKKHIMEEKYDHESLLNRTIDHFVYGDFYKTSTSMTIEEKQGEIDELKQCLERQHQRAMQRLITYRFSRTFIQKILNLSDDKAALKVLSVYLPFMRNNDFDWSYFDLIPASNNQLRDDISNVYYSIVKLVLPSMIKSNHFAQNVFYLMNVSYELIDISHLYAFRIIENLFNSFVSLRADDTSTIKVELRLSAFNWFRLLVLRLCETIEMEKLRDPASQTFQQQAKFVFNTLIFNNLKTLKTSMISTESSTNSLENVDIKWFLHMKENNESKTILFINQYIALLLRCVYFYKHILSICTTSEYLQELLDIYQCNQSNVTRLLTIKLLRHLIPAIADHADGIPRAIIQKFLIDVLDAIGDETSVSEDILAELISMYRTIMTVESAWKAMAVELVCNSIRSNLNADSIERNNSGEMKSLRAALNVLGGYIEPYRLGSIVNGEKNKKLNDDSPLALIIEINQTEMPYVIQYSQTNQTESVSIDKLQLKVDVPPPSLPDQFESLLDLFEEFIQIDTKESLMFVQLKRLAISVLYYLLNNTKVIEIFMQKPCASLLAKLCVNSPMEGDNQQPKDLRVFDKQHLEQYYLSLNHCESKGEITQDNEEQEIVQDSIIVTDQDDSAYTIWNRTAFKSNPSIVDALTTHQGWKPCISEGELQYYKRGRTGDNVFSIAPRPRNIASNDVMQECGVKHRFRGRIAPNYENTTVSFPTFVLENIAVSEGNWYFCVRLPVGGVLQIGWATTEFCPSGSTGVGDDKYSWSYDGSRAVFFNDQGFYSQFNDIRWNENDVCGCGIEINGKNTKIKYWLNGKLLGTAFEHDKYIPLSTTKCNLLPHGLITTYYPSITIQWGSDPLRSCEVIVSPEDMQDCPLPHGYKPLMLPDTVPVNNVLVDYPFHAYLVSNAQQDFVLESRTKSTGNLLRDFIHEHNLQTTFILEQDRLVLPEDSPGFLLSVNNEEITTLTISFDFEVLNDSHDIQLITFDSTDIIWQKPNELAHCVIIFLAKRRQLKVYVNNQCQIFSDTISNETIKILNMYILPGTAARMNNLAVWKHALSEEQIRRLFTYGLFYVGNDYQRIKDYRKQVNTITFFEGQASFVDGTLLPFNAPFSESTWEQKKKEAEPDEAKYFKSYQGYSTVELHGHNTYLILDKSDDEWTSYTLVFDLCIPQYPPLGEKLVIVTLNSRSMIFIASNGKLCLKSEDQKDESTNPIVLNEYFRLFITVQPGSIEMYFNNDLNFTTKIDDDRYDIKSNYLEFFRQTDETNSITDENTLRVALKSLTYLNRAITLDQYRSPTLLLPPTSIIGPSLLAMGYKNSWIETTIDQYKPSDLSVIHTILREQKSQFIKADLEHDRKRYENLLTKIDPSIDSQLLTDLLNQPTHNIAERLFAYWKSNPSLKFSKDTMEFEGKLDPNWFRQAIQDFDMNPTIYEWIQEKSSTGSNNDDIYQLFDVDELSKKKQTSITPPSVRYSHENISLKQFQQARLACEYGLTTIYARYTILNMLEVWSLDETARFPLEKFGDYKFLIFLLKILDSTKLERNEDIDRIHNLIHSIVKNELKQLIQDTNTTDLEIQAPLLYHLQKDLLMHSIDFLFQPSLLSQQSDVDFFFKVVNLLIELITDKSLIHARQIDHVVPILFPTPLINLLFDLFVIVPTHQSKLFIINVFTSLIQISKSVKLNNRIEKFFYHLLIELSSKSVSLSSTSKKNFEIALADFVYVLLTEQKKPSTTGSKQIQEFQSKLPEHIQNLFISVNAIHTWTNPTKESSLPEEFLKQTKKFLVDKYKITQEDFGKSNQHFNHLSDQDLINFMNNSSQLNDSITSFLDSLPSESEPNAAFYSNYPHLLNIPADAIQIRAKFIYVLNKFVEDSLSLVDFNLPQGRSYLTDQIRQIKNYLLTSTKMSCFRESLQKTEGAYTNDYQNVHFDTVKASTDTDKSENTMFYQAYQQLYANAHVIFRRGNEQLWQAQYTGMHSTDSGGPYRDSITRICMDICSTRLPLFILCPNGRTNSGLNRDCWIPHSFPPNKPISKKIVQQYRFVGQLMGLAMRKKHYLDIKFAHLVWKQLLKEEITVEDIEAIDIQSFRIINEMEKNIETMRLTETDNDMGSMFSSIMSELRFDVVSSSGLTYELVPSGSELPITASNFKQYCSLYRQYRLNEFNRQINFIREGIFSIVPSYYLNLFTANELEETVCGKGQIDVELLKRNTTYSYEYNPDCETIQLFWTVLSDMFTDEQRKLFLIFVWGRNTLPTRDEDFQCKFTISKLDIYGDASPDKTLPRSHTCFFTIDLPTYSTKEIMYERLNYAITCCSSIDGDGTINDAPNADELIFEDIFD
ncbi:unnamed protein product [Adineta ricciae]|uniref:Uncharacterized protein n=1 Tax=Adineta ricciae TaxID=249248 RepID=A0A814RSA7_ADIRI|nr:unnamed protein product [Adineta ricciae]CAF1136626.1 unnamed protein product [Adineta ricciae]